MNYEDIISLILFFLWDVVLYILIIGKIAQSGAFKFFQHLTNIGLTLSAVLFTLDILSRADTRKMTKSNPLRTDSIVTTIFYWTAQGVEWIIFWLFLIIVYENPNILQSEFKENGGQYYAGFVYVMNTVFHVIPALMLLAYTFLRREPIKKSVQFFMANRIDLFIRVGFALTEVLFLPGFIVLMYFLTIDTQTIYGYDISNLAMIFIGIGVLSATNGIIFLGFYFKTIKK